jgi:hypothetical protein
MFFLDANPCAVVNNHGGFLMFAWLVGLCDNDLPVFFGLPPTNLRSVSGHRFIDYAKIIMIIQT